MNCLNCEKEILKTRKFCCLSCSVIYNNKKRKKIIKIKNCLNCNKEITGRNIFCGHSCSAEFNNKKRIKRIKKTVTVIEKIKIEKIKERKKCLTCEKELSRNNKKFCDNFCSNEFRYKEYIKKWKNGEVDGMRGSDQTSEHIRKYLFIKYNNKCSEDGWNKINPFTKKIPLEVEHIDGDNQNNKEENLKLLCPSCHSLTKTYKGANKGNGRKHRRSRYLKNADVV